MNDLLARTNTTVNRHDRRWIVVGACAIALTSVLWHVTYPTILRTAARYNLGSSERETLIVAALRSTGLSVVRPDEWFRSYRQPAPGCVVWQMRKEQRHPFFADVTTTIGLADAHFSLQGTWCVAEGYGIPQAAPTHCDNDGFYDVILDIVDLVPINRILYRYGVVRIYPHKNELLGLFAVDSAALKTPGPTYGDFDVHWEKSGDDSKLAIDLVTEARLRSPTYRYTFEVDRRRIATFAWSATGDVLIPQYVSDEKEIRIWQPPEGKPFCFSPDTPIEGVFRQCLPLPNSPSATPLPTSPTTAPQPADQ